MSATPNKKQKFMLDLEMLNTLNAEGCVACGRKFTLGETVVMACGQWERLKPIHENEAIWDAPKGMYVERSCYKAQQR